jgi:voltage-gated potassium channel Kch
VRQAAAAGDSVVYGDAARREVLVAAALSRAVGVVVTFADTPKALAILAHVRELRPELPVVVRTFDDSDVGRLREAGAAEIVAEVVEGSLMLATQTMLQLGVPLNRVLRTLARRAPGALPARCAATSPAPPTIEADPTDAAAPAHRRSRATTPRASARRSAA